METSPPQSPTTAYTIYTWFLKCARVINPSKKLPLLLVIFAFISGIATYIQLTMNDDILQKSKSVVALIYVDILLLMILAIIVVKRLVELWVRRKTGQAGSKLHINIVVLFSLVAVLPAISVTLFSGAFLNVGLQAWFGEPVRHAIQESKAVAESYFIEHKRNLRFEALTLANDIKNTFPGLSAPHENPDAFQKNLNLYLSQQEEQRFFNELMIVRILPNGQDIIGKSMLTFALEVDSISDTDLIAAQNNVVAVREFGDRVRAIVTLDPFQHIYLLVGKFIDKKVLQHVEETRNAYSNYHHLETQKSGMEVTFLLLFSLITLLLLLCAVWVGLTFATIIVKPIGKLIQAADDVSHGNLDTKITHDPLNNEIDQLITSFNDMTRRLKSQQNALILSEKKAAWSDVARKIAHEIKNPLTPIQLSAERLKRKYLKVLDGDTQSFEQCIDTIVRQVSHIENLVREFSDFARMPDPVIETHNIMQIYKNAAFLEQQAHTNITFSYDGFEDIVHIKCDAQQMSQVFTNLLKNSTNVLSESQTPHDAFYIRTTFESEGDTIRFIIDDNGPGFPKVGREKLLEPYYTTREKGTGLGLSIVAKIMTDHGGELTLSDNPHGGARVILTLSKKGVKS